MTGGAHFGCGPDSEVLAAELADLVHGSWAPTTAIQGVVLMANGARVPRDLPGQPSEAARSWWRRSVATVLAPRDAERESVAPASPTNLRIDNPWIQK
jgi:hypothetical protein